MNNKITDSIIYVGANDYDIDLFEGHYVVPNGVAYNSYVIMDQKVTVMDTVDQRKTSEWLQNINRLLPNRAPDYLVVQHMEPDHAGSIQAFLNVYPNTTVVGNEKTFTMMYQFFPDLEIRNKLVVVEGDTLALGQHTLTFVFAPMVHWPEVMVTYESSEKVLFSADGFGKFGVIGANEPWADEARRYFIGIVGKYGAQVQALLQKAAGIPIEKILPLHGPILTENLGYYLGLYDAWSSYTPEEDGIVIAYTSVYGHTKVAAEKLYHDLQGRGVPNVILHDLARTDITLAVADAFKYDKLVLATTTFNAEIFPFMREFISHLVERNFQNRTIAFIENGSWAPNATAYMQGMLKDCKNLKYAENNVTITSALNADSTAQLEKLADELAMEATGVQIDRANPINPAAQFKLGYGLYVVTAHDGTKHNGQIVNTVSQVGNNPDRFAVNLNKSNYTADIIYRTGTLNVCVLNQDAPFSVFQQFGFQSGRDVDKFADYKHCKVASNGIAYLTKYANSYMSMKVTGIVDMGSHWMFICELTESAVLNNVETMTYTYYQENVKPKPQAEVKGWVCSICGYVYEGDDLPADYICPLCKHPASDFEKM